MKKLLFGITLILSAFLSSVSAQDELPADRTDMLAYVSNENRLMLYDPRERTETTVLENVSTFKLGQDGRVAFTKLDENDTDLYVFDPATPDLAPINISQNPAANHYPVAWSPDGHYLAYVSFRESSDNPPYLWIYQGRYLASSDDQALYVWDGEKAANVMPNNGLDRASGFFVDWSYDGRLAFRAEYGWSDSDTPPEIYLWDGKTTTNLSQNPERHDGGVVWNKAGQLMFSSQQGEEGSIYIWDGVSFQDGLPDINSFIRVAPELEPTDATWTEDGFISITTYSDSSDRNEIILWDWKNKAIVKQFPVSSDKAYSWLAEGGQFILSSHLASGIPSVYLDVESIEGEILLSVHTGEYAWSADGYLAYCGIEERMSRILSIWDGGENWIVTRVSYQPVQWQNGQDTFSCNNG